ncbi:glycosyltransferase family 2 protein [Kocuria rhizophila]|nr:glycosyltransferase family 2 protein [Kocuria rhizophila]
MRVERVSAAQGRTCSVVIPVRNDAAYLERCLRALREQTRVPDEIVVVDNASSDHLREVLARHPEVQCVREPEPGVAHAAAAGYDAARGDLILRCDADSLPAPTWIERHVSSLTRALDEPRGRDAVAVSGVARFGPQCPGLGRIAGAAYITAYRLVAGTALGHWALWGSDMAFTREWWRRVSVEVHRDARVHDDFDLSFRVRPHERVLMDPGSAAVVSWRAVVSPARIRRQLRMASATVAANWRAQRPWVRIRRRLLGGRGDRA